MTVNKEKIVNLNINNENDRVLDFSDFQKQTISFDIDKLQDAYNQIVKIKKFDDGGGVTNFGAISLTQIPGDPDSIKGSKARGVYWTKPDKSGKEVSRDVNIDESKYSEFINPFDLVNLLFIIFSRFDPDKYSLLSGAQLEPFPNWKKALLLKTSLFNFLLLVAVKINLV